MVQVIEGRQRRVSVPEQLLHGGLEGGLNALSEYKENQALKNRGIDLSGIRNPETRQQIIAQELQFGKNRRMAESSPSILEQQPEMEVNQVPERNKNFVNENKPQRQRMPKFAERQQQPVYEDRGEYTNFPQEATTGQKLSVKSPEELEREAYMLHKQSLNTANPISQMEALQFVKNRNDLRREHNADVGQEAEIRKNAQRDYGTKADEALQKVYQDEIPSDEIRGLFQKEAERAAELGMSEADFTKLLGEKVRTFKDALTQIRKLPAPNRSTNEFYRKMMGEGRDSEKMIKDAKRTVQPFLDLGLYNEARAELDQVGYYPEEIENIISSLGENSKKVIAELPKMEKVQPSLAKKLKGKAGALAASSLGPVAGTIADIYGKPESYYTPMQELEIYDNIREALASDPTANLILMRKAYEDKGVDWSTFLDGINKAIDEGILDLDKYPKSGQRNMYDNLKTPPLNGLTQILHGLGIVGR